MSLPRFMLEFTDEMIPLELSHFPSRGDKIIIKYKGEIVTCIIDRTYTVFDGVINDTYVVIVIDMTVKHSIRSEFGDDKLLICGIDREKDDELMILIKTLLIHEKITVGQFKELYGEDGKDTMFIDKNTLETSHTISFDKFKFILNLLFKNVETSIVQ